MKKFIFLLTIILSLTFSVYDTKAACPTGWDSYSFTFTYEDCEYTVNYCLQVTPTGVINTTIDTIFVEQDSSCFMYLSTQDYWDELYSEMNSDIISNASLPPCPLTVYNTSIELMRFQKS